MKKIIALVLVAVLAMSCLTGCGSKGKTIDDIKKAGKLSIATSPDFPPFENLEDNGSVEGIEIDILKLICSELGVELEINQMAFDSVIPGIQAGKFDLGVSGISVTDDRKENALFTNPYCLAAQAIVVVEGSPITCKKDLEGKTVSVQTGTTAEEYCGSQNYTVNGYESNSDAELAAVNGKVDAWVIDDLTAAEMVAAYNAENSTKLVILSEAMTTEPYAFATNKNNSDLIAGINEILDKLVADGTVEELFRKYDAPYTKP